MTQHALPESLYGMRGHNIEDQMNSILVRIIEGLVRGRVVEPPQLAFLHANLVPPDLEVAAVDTLQSKVIAR